MKLVLLSQDLMIGARIEGAAKQAGLTTTIVRDQASLEEALSDGDARLVFLDLKVPGLDVSGTVEAVRSLLGEHLPIIACGPHVHEAKLEAARAAGCDMVVTRGQLDREAESLFSRLLNADMPEEQ